MIELTKGGRNWKLEYTFEAAHYQRCVEKAWDYFSGAMALREAAAAEGKSQAEQQMGVMNGIINSMVAIPDLVLLFIYAGLIEHHGREIKTEADARQWYKEYCLDYPDTTDVDMLEKIRQCMEDDGFFRRIGLDKMLESMKTDQKKSRKASTK